MGVSMDAGELELATRMPYWGKVVGTVAGLASGRPWLGLLGLLLGHQFDRGFAARASRVANDSSNLGQLPASFVKPLFQIMGHLAKADGRVTEDEIRAARALMHRLGLESRDIRQAIGWFEAGKNPAFPLRTAAREMRRAAGRNADSRHLFVHLLLETSLSKGSLHQRERALLWAVCGELDIGRVELAQLEAMLRAQRGFRRSAAGSLDAERLAAAYATLGVAQSASNDEIKQAYRRLMNRSHPDKLAGTDADAGDIAAAQKRTRDIRSAWEMLKARRTIR